MDVKIQDKKVIITLPLQEPKLSKSGKSYLIATTNGFVQTTERVNNKEVSVSVNVIIPV
jgi:hypothetical protein